MGRFVFREDGVAPSGARGSKVKCRHGSIELGIERAERPAAWDSGAWEINVTALRNFFHSASFLPYLFIFTNSHNIGVSFSVIILLFCRLN